MYTGITCLVATYIAPSRLIPQAAYCHLLQAFGVCAFVQPKRDEEQATAWVSVIAAGRAVTSAGTAWDRGTADRI